MKKTFTHLFLQLAFLVGGYFHVCLSQVIFSLMALSQYVLPQER